MSSYSYRYMVTMLGEDDEGSPDAAETAPTGQVYVCTACGKRSRDREGAMAIDEGWDISCVLRAVLCEEASIVLGKDGRVRQAKMTPGQD